jgi:hypothetical protein
MADDRQIRKKIEELFGESNKTFERESLNPTERSELQDLENQDVQEVAEYLKHQFTKEEKKQASLPKRRWKWNFYGFWWFKVILFVLEFFVLTLSIYFLVPLSINNTVTLIQAFSSATLLTILRQWTK